MKTAASRSLSESTKRGFGSYSRAVRFLRGQYCKWTRRITPKYRAVTADLFHPRALAKIEGDVRRIARGFIEKMIGTGGRCDFATEVAFLYPLRVVVMSIIGVPESDEPLMLRLRKCQ
jgi:hypothetical protein